VGDKTLAASPGDFVRLPRGIAHSFRNTSKEHAKMLVTCTPAGLEDYFAETLSPAVEGEEAPMVTEALMMRLMAAAPRFGVELIPPSH
jgi:uncharacterized RmlC-like cupin family protein